MSDERFDIEVTDKVSANVEKKLTGIAKAAVDAYNKVEQLKSSLSSVNTTAIDKLTNASAKVTNALARETAAQAKLQAASAKTAVADAQAAVAKQRLATETARTEAAQAASNREALKGATAAVQLEAAQARLAATQARQAAQAAKSAKATEDLANKQNKAAGSAGLQRHETQNLAAQLQDIVVSLQGGQKPLTVFLQQGGQIGQIFSGSGQSLRAFAASIAVGVVEMLPMIAVVLAAGAAVAFFIGKLQENGKALAKLKEEHEKLKEEVDRNTGATALAKDGLVAYDAWVLENTGSIEEQTKALRKNTLELLNNNSIKAAAQAQEFKRRNDTFGSRFILGIGKDVAPEKYAKAVKEIADQQAEYDRIAKKAQETLAAAGQAPDIAFSSRMQSNQKKADAKAARDAAADAKRAAAAEESRAVSLSKLNLQLSNEYERMGLLKDERDKAARFDQIEETLAGKKITLNAKEKQSIIDKIEAIQSYTRVQAEVDRIYQETSGPQQSFNAALAASSQLLDKGKISLAQWNEQNAKATEAYKQASEPLYTHNKALNDQLATMGLFGDALEKANYLQSVQNSLQAQGKSLYDASTGALTSEAAALLAKWQALQQGAYVQSQVNAALADTTANEKFVANYQSMIDRIDQMRKGNLISERAAAVARNEIQTKYDKLRLQNVTTTLDAIAQLSSSGNKKLAAIGKAAAIANATINAYEAVSKALTLPFPLNFAAAAAVSVAAGAQVAGIAGVNVGGFNTGGSFTVGGKQGRDRNRIAMDVSRGERVSIETAAQQRAAERASTASVANDNSFSQKVTINNLGTGVTARVESVTRDEVKIMIEDTVAKRAPQVVARQMSDPNSEVSKAQTRNFKTERKR